MEGELVGVPVDAEAGIVLGGLNSAGATAISICWAVARERKVVGMIRNNRTTLNTPWP